MKKPIRIGIVGAGTNTRTMHIPKLQEIEGVEIVSVCNRSHASSERVAKQFDIPKIYEDWSQLIKAPDTDAIVIGTWPYLHCRATLAALAANKHVLVEARMAMDASEAAQMVAASQAKPKLITQVVPSPLSFSVDKTIQRLIADGYLGEILAIEVRDHNGRFLDKQAPLHWRQNRDLSGLNVMNLGIWYESLMRWVGEATAVHAMGKTFMKLRTDSENGRLTAVHIPEHLTVMAEMACGAQATFSMSQVTGLRHVQEAVLYGSEGTLVYNLKSLQGGRRGDEQLKEIPITEEDKGAWRVEAEFIYAIRGLETIELTSFNTGLKYMQFTETVAQSMREGQNIKI